MDRESYEASRNEKISQIKTRIKAYPNFPKPGVLFRDIFPLFHQPSLLPTLVDLFKERIISNYPDHKIEMVVGIDSRGFLFGPELARVLNCDFVPARKKGKLPGETVEESYELEYGSNTVEMQKEYLIAGKTAIVVDDLIATGGTMAAVYNLLTNANVKVLECQCIVELPELKGREKLPKECAMFCLVQYEGE